MSVRSIIFFDDSPSKNAGFAARGAKAQRVLACTVSLPREALGGVTRVQRRVDANMMDNWFIIRCQLRLREVDGGDMAS